jgi:hypothetical protein
MKTFQLSLETYRKVVCEALNSLFSLLNNFIPELLSMGYLILFGSGTLVFEKGTKGFLIYHLKGLTVWIMINIIIDKNRK